jgi:hypothetical protein
MAAMSSWRNLSRLVRAVTCHGGDSICASPFEVEKIDLGKAPASPKRGLHGWMAAGDEPGLKREVSYSATRVAGFRAAIPSIRREDPVVNRFKPTSAPIAAGEFHGHWIEISPPSNKVIKPFTSSHTEPLSFRVLKYAMKSSVPSTKIITDKSCVIEPSPKSG